MIDTAKLAEPALIYWRRNTSCPTPLHECLIGDQMVAWIEARPSYCDRGHWKMCCELPDIDGADSFPRYFMSLKRAKAETEAFLKWRLWKVRAEWTQPATEALQQALRGGHK